MPDYYTVASGDSWESIARSQMGNEREFGNLMAANGGGFFLRPGMRIELPGRSSGTPFVSNELAASLGMATSGQISGAYNADPRGVQKTGMSGDWNANPILGQQNQIWSSMHARGDANAPDLVYGNLPDAFTKFLGGLGGTSTTGGTQSAMPGNPGGIKNATYAQAGASLKNAVGNPGGVKNFTYADYVKSLRGNVKGLGSEKGGGGGVSDKAGYGSLPGKGNRTIPLNGVIPAMFARFGMGGQQTIGQHGNAVRPGEHSIQSMPLFGGGQATGGPFKNGRILQDGSIMNLINGGNATGGPFVGNTGRMSTDGVAVGGPFIGNTGRVGDRAAALMPITLLNLIMGAGAPKAYSPQEETAVKPGVTGYSATDAANIRASREAGTGAYAGVASGGLEQTQVTASSIADLLALYHIGPAIWQLDWTAVRAGANIQPYGYTRDYNYYGDSGGTQQYQQNYTNPYAGMNLTLST